MRPGGFGPPGSARGSVWDRGAGLTAAPRYDMESPERTRLGRAGQRQARSKAGKGCDSPASRPVCAVPRRHCGAVPGLRGTCRGKKRAVSHGETARTERRHGRPARPRPARGRRAPPTLRPPRLGVPVRRSHWPPLGAAPRSLAEAGSGEPCAQRRGGVSRGAVCTPRVAQAAGSAGPSERSGAETCGGRGRGEPDRRYRREAARGPQGRGRGPCGAPRRQRGHCAGR